MCDVGVICGGSLVRKQYGFQRVRVNVNCDQRAEDQTWLETSGRHSMVKALEYASWMNAAPSSKNTCRRSTPYLDTLVQPQGALAQDLRGSLAT